MVYEAWRYLDPGDVVEASIRLSERECGTNQVKGETKPTKHETHQPRDRYYTLARRLHVKRIMRGKLNGKK